VLLSLGAILVGAAIVAAVPALRDAVSLAFQGDTQGLRERLHDLGVGGVLLLEGVIVAHAVVFFPAEIIDLAAGYVYGFWLAFPLLLVGWVLSCLAAYGLGRGAGRPLVVRLVGTDRWAEAERLIDRGGAWVLVLARLVPIVPLSLTGYVAGAARVPLWRFTWTSALGVTPLLVSVVLLGARLDELHAGDPVLWGTIALFAGLVGLGVRLRRRLTR
jgi:uncharacterized membrane protein YdjX (TVP38/TMEM64 family)